LSQILSSFNPAELLGDPRQRSHPAHPRTEEIQVQVDGQPRWLRATSASVIDAEGQPIGTVVALHDMSRAKQVQKRYAEFVTAVGHELKTPLTSIKAFAEMLVDGEATEQGTQQELFNVIDTQTDRLTRLIDNLLNLGRIEAGVAKVNKDNCSLNELLECALQVAQPTAQAKKIVLKRDLSKLHLAVHADRDMLTQAMINLLSNAVKYTPAMGEVLVRSRLTEGHAEFEVRDTGYGISAEDQDRIFQKFYRVKDKTGETPGTGLGLPLVKQIVEDVHGGSIRVTSTPGQGSSFTVASPLAQ
jgi:two-component system phosphate regulon sensor histidine kinase PhoR